MLKHLLDLEIIYLLGTASKEFQGNIIHSFQGGSSFEIQHSDSDGQGHEGSVQKINITITRPLSASELIYVSVWATNGVRVIYSFNKCV